MSHTISSLCTGCTACIKICPVLAITGERKLVHTIDLSLCIDCSACGRICPADAVLDSADQIILHSRRTQWQKPSVKESGCISCMVCLQSCPVNCLDWGSPDPISHRVFPVLKMPGLCIACEFCARACPVDAIEMIVPPDSSRSQE